MTPNDLLTLKMILTESPRKTEQNTLLVLKNLNFDVSERKNEFHGTHATYRLWLLVGNRIAESRTEKTTKPDFIIKDKT